MWVTSRFETPSGPAVGLLPTISIRSVDDGFVVSSGVMDEIGDGFYKYEFFGYEITKNYTILCDAVTIPKECRYQAVTSGEWGGVINNINLVSDEIDFRMDLVRKIVKNKLVLVDGTTENLIVYDEDDVSERIKWNVTDSSDVEITQEAHNTARRTRGV